MLARNSEFPSEFGGVCEVPEHPAVAELKELLRERTAQRDALNEEIDAFCYSVSHDFRAAILGIAACSRILMDDFGAGLSEDARQWLDHIHEDSVQLDKLAQALIELSRATRKTLDPADLDLTAMAREVVLELQSEKQDRSVEFVAGRDLKARGDSALVRTLLRHLLDNAWKFTANSAQARVEFGALPCDPSSNSRVFYVRDNGVGFDTAQAHRLFVPFQRLHRDPECRGNGVGLATVRRIAHQHGGKAWADGTPGAGATFFFTLDGRLA